MKREQRLNCKPIISALISRGFSQAGLVPPGETKTDVLEKTSLPARSSIIIAFFPIELKGQNNIASFAVKNYYKEMIIRMKDALKASGEPFSRLSKRDVRFFSNSSLPEKKMAEASGLGFIGRNTLLLNKTYGSRGLLAGMILPLELEEPHSSADSFHAVCGTCRACEMSCPGNALGDYKLNRENCLQHWTSSEGIIPDRLKDVWENRIYGCTVCQDVCPWNRKAPPVCHRVRGEISPVPDLSFYLSHPEEEVKEYFKGTAMGMKWFSAKSIIRNAVLSARKSENEEILGRVEKFRDSEDAGIRDAARWVLKKIRPDRER